MFWEILFPDFCPRKYRFTWQNVIMFRRPGVSPFCSVKIPTTTINWLVQQSFSHHQFHDQYTSRPSGVLQWWNLLSYQPVEIFWCNKKMVPKIWQTLQTPGTPLQSRMSKSTNPSSRKTMTSFARSDGWTSFRFSWRCLYHRIHGTGILNHTWILCRYGI